MYGFVCLPSAYTHTGTTITMPKIGKKKKLFFFFLCVVECGVANQKLFMATESSTHTQECSCCWVHATVLLFLPRLQNCFSRPPPTLPFTHYACTYSAIFNFTLLSIIVRPLSSTYTVEQNVHSSCSCAYMHTLHSLHSLLAIY